MTDEELLGRLSRIEVREGKERQIKSYVLRNNVLSDREKEIVLAYMREYGLFFEEGKLDPKEIYGNDNPFVIEIGFGMGDATTRIALEKRDVNFLGLEVYLMGFVKLLRDIGDNGIRNLRIMRFNAVDVLERMVEDGSVDGFHIFFPDPWPKKKHHKRRLLNDPFLRLLSSKLKKGGYIYFVTDWQEYADEVLEISKGIDTLSNPSGGFAETQKWRPRTKFERKGVDKDHQISEIWLIRK